ncbi:MAG: hypothetical protein ACO39X_08400, partial [Candidatus Nanopelagicaceae bacterium]
LTEAVEKFYGPATMKSIAGAKAAKAAKKEMNAVLKQLTADSRRVIKLIRENEKLEKQRAKLLEEAKEKLTKEWDDRIAAEEDKLKELTDAYDEANDTLKDLVSKRDQFIKALKDGARSFVNALSLDKETVDTYYRLGADGSFVMKSEEQTKSFRDSLADRLAALKDWWAKIKSLREAGLDENLLQDLIAAGPDASKDAVNDLASAGQDVIDEVNSIQAELGELTEGMGDYVNDAWHQAGISVAEGVADAAKAALEEQKKYLEELEKQREEAFKALEEQYENYQDELGQKIKANEKEAIAISNKIQAEYAKMAKSAYAKGVETSYNLLEGLTNDSDKIVAA